jgi:ubiquinone/menaquinone biosynthesis C-methylase UbiE
MTVKDILPVTRSKEEAIRFYDRVSTLYDYFAGSFERKYSEMALERLSVAEGDAVLEIGFGSGHCLGRIAKSVGPTGKVSGIDISSGMLKVAKRRLRKAQLLHLVQLQLGDAAKLPYRANIFDAVFISFALELFDTPEIPKVLEEIQRILKPGGRIAIVSMSKGNRQTLLLRLYEWAHIMFPGYVDCRPIYLKQSLMSAGYEIHRSDKLDILGLPIEIDVALKKQSL